MVFATYFFWASNDVQLSEQVVLMNGRVFQSVESSRDWGSGDHAGRIWAKLVIWNTLRDGRRKLWCTHKHGNIFSTLWRIIYYVPNINGVTIALSPVPARGNNKMKSFVTLPRLVGERGVGEKWTKTTNIREYNMHDWRDESRATVLTKTGNVVVRKLSRRKDTDHARLRTF